MVTYRSRKLAFLAVPMRLTSLTTNCVQQLDHPGGETEWVVWRPSQGFLAIYFQGHFRVK